MRRHSSGRVRLTVVGDVLESTEKASSEINSVEARDSKPPQHEPPWVGHRAGHPCDSERFVESMPGLPDDAGGRRLVAHRWRNDKDAGDARVC